MHHDPHSRASGRAGTKAIDPLTGVPNRSACLRTLRRLTESDSALPLAVLWLNLDRFKQINDSFGHQAGDALLIEIVRRLEPVRGLGHLARMGADEFVLLVPDCDRPHAEALGQRVLDLIHAPFQLGNLRLHPSASIGVTLSQGTGAAHDLLELADRAMLEAKRRGGGQCLFASDLLDAVGTGPHLAREALSLEGHLHQALDTGGLSLDYQPILRVCDGRLEGVEALLRCRVDGVHLPPSRFIPVAEKTGLISRLGEWSLLTAARFVHRLNGAGRPVKAAVNVSRAQLTAPKFSQVLHTALACSDVPAGSIELEITESLFMDRSPTVQKNIHAAQEAGVPLAIDDFGTGYSCLAVLKDLPAQKIKLDRAFVADLPQDRRSLAVTRSIVQMALDLGMSVVAEGVETAEQYDALCETGVTAVQGYHIAQPMTESTFEGWLAARGQP